MTRYADTVGPKRPRDSIRGADSFLSKYSDEEARDEKGQWTGSAALAHDHPTEVNGAHAMAHRALRSMARGFSGHISLQDWGYGRYNEARHVARMHGMGVTRIRDRSNPMKQHFETNPGVKPIPHHAECTEGKCPGIS